MADAGADYGGAHYVSEAPSPSRMILKMAL